jgi:hypothetical protein
MANEPEQVTDYDPRGAPLSAQCSICKAQMPPMKSKGGSKEELLKWYSIQFALHGKEHLKKRDY